MQAFMKRAAAHSRAIGASLGVVATVVASSVVISAGVASAAVVTTFSTGALSCPNGTTAMLAQWSGSLRTTGDAITSTGTPSGIPFTIDVNTASSGYPVGSVQTTVSRVSVDDTADPAGDGFLQIFTVGGTPAEYAVPHYEMGHDTGTDSDRYTVVLNFPSPTRFYMPFMDVDGSEYGTVTAMNGATPVLPTVTVRDAGNLTVTNAGSTASFANNGAATNDNDGLGMLEISSNTPVTSVTLVNTVPLGSNELGNIFGCQGQDLVKQTTVAPAVVSSTATTVTYDAQVQLRLGNAGTGNMQVYGPQITDDLTAILGGTPAPTAISMTSAPTATLTGTGGSTGCVANAGYTGTGVNTLLTGTTTNFLASGDSCLVTVNLRVTYPTAGVTASFTKNNTAAASGQGTTAAINDTSTNSATLPSTIKGDTASVTPLLFPVDVVDAVDDAFGSFNPGASTVSVLGNDTLNGNPATVGNVILTPGTPTNPGLIMNADGIITVAANTTAGVHRFPYTICSQVNSDVCDTAVATVTVPAVIVASDNPFGVVTPGGITPSVLDNDTANGNSVVAGTNVTLTPGTPSDGGLVMNADGTITVSANLPGGTYSYPYTICSTVDPTVCANAVATITIESMPPIPTIPPTTTTPATTTTMIVVGRTVPAAGSDTVGMLGLAGFTTFAGICVGLVSRRRRPAR